MNVLVTGGAGFLGSHLVELLLAAGHAVTVLDNLTTGSAANVPAGARLLQADVRTPLAEAFAAARPRVVVHLAAQVSVPASLADPGHDLAVNAGGTVNVLAAAARAGARKVVLVSSAAVYGIPPALPIQESSPAAPLSPYGLSKWTAEQYVRLLGARHGLAYTILRPANIYGPRQTAEGEGAVVPSFLDRFLSGRDPVIHGDGSQTRDFIYVADMARAILQALDRADGLTLNVSSGTGTPIRDLWHLLAGLLGWRRAPVYGPPRPGDIPHSVMDNTAARQHLHWEPQVALASGLAQTVAWARLAEVAAARESEKAPI